MKKLLHIGFETFVCVLFLVTSLQQISRGDDLLFPSQPAVQELPRDLTEIGLQRLLDFDLIVTSPGKKEQMLSNVASATYVLSQEDIKRSGATHVAELLRLVPGVDVARVSSTQWAVSVRGFNQVYANKLLVLIDGISVFSPLTNGVYWETLDPVLEDIERIEVIRGPGAALWGSNAVNGVINIITKKAKDTQGGLMAGGGGTHERGFGTFRYGGEFSSETLWRVAGKFADREHNRLRAGGDAEDEWQIGSGEMRLDSNLGGKDSLTILGKAFSEENKIQTDTPIPEPPFHDPTSFSGQGRWKGVVTGVKWKREFSPTSDLDALLSYRFQELASKIISFDYHIYNVDIRHRFSPLEAHDVVYGAEFQLFHNDANGTFAQDLEPEKRTTNRVTGFVQDEIALIRDRLQLILGSKFERNSSTGFEYMPNGRIIWTPDEKNSVWAAISRAVAPPSLVFEDVIFPVAAFPQGEGIPNGVVTVFGSRGVESEVLLAYEVGYRTQLRPRMALDLASFYNRYDNILSLEPGQPFVGVPNMRNDPAVIIPLQFSNALAGDSLGGEVALEWSATDWWRMIGGYSLIDINVFPGDSQDSGDRSLIEGGTPQNQITLRSLIDLPFDLSFDSLGHYVGRVHEGDIKSYVELDLRLGWKLRKNWEISLVGQNLLHNAHQEFVGNLFGPPPTKIERAAYAKVVWQF